MILKVMYMEKQLKTYINRLIVLDSKAVEFKGEKDAELLKLESNIKNELGSIADILEEAALGAKQEHDRIIEDAKMQAKEMNEAAEHRISELQTSFLSFKDHIAGDIWKQLLNKSQK